MATGTRIRYNISKGRIGAAMTSGDTTLDLTEDPGWAALAGGEYIALTLSDEEIVHVTNYSSGASTCTIERGQEGTTAVSHGVGDTWVAAPTTQDYSHEELSDLDGDAHPDLLNDTRHDALDHSAALSTVDIGDLSDVNAPSPSADEALVYNGAVWAAQPLTLGLREVVVFGSSGTFTKGDYPWLRSVRVKVQGAGGGAGGVPSTSAGEASASGAGGGGGYSEAFIDVGTLGTNETVTVGTGGAGGAAGLNNGTAGGDSSFGTHATGGGGGAGTGETVLSVTEDLRPGLNAAGGTGGTAADGDINIPGASGEGGLVSTLRVATARGGSSFLSTSVGRRDVTLTTTPGVDGQAYGGGGGGAANAESEGSKAGGDGADGIVIVELYG